ncbi:tRNA-dihydrouridine synthase C [Neisseria sp. N95_16]|uniref:tRNA-dihydrouridine(16) synthase n=1 Tax=Neisseria brasiliensis TaxID=2666100 RepID=A0A5Q3S3A6_9NEIS|nr:MULTISPECIES: tRNA-dihydrouridine synthase [Neisseria]MRN39348.1 tRNA-dihydrouridine synthase [Neisseria brasiliensis]PJO09907.1 tRNA-dihydrouridine synthase C [Neisseria sp. N95_16]PJO77978.1 tRNA-dihydrouridine synthase C [Neisseria sp. N177_16]QGL26511.1 tRNA-dihydrouridine synthase [Neisseria brasiliensis]
MRLLLAPMQGLCDDVMRDLLTRIGGYDECVSEFVRITHTVHSRATWLKYVPEIANGNQTFAGTPCTVQLLGSDADNMAVNALEAVRFGADKIDLNFGCPAPTVNKHKGGAVLLKEPELIHHIVKTLRSRLPEHIPLTGKMRLGFENTDLALECAAAIAEGGACGLTVHARTKVEGYEPPAHWDWVRKIRDAVSIPVTANGDVFTLEDYLAIKEVSGCDSVMLGRGAVIRPDLARQIKQYEYGETVKPTDFAEIASWINLFFDLCVAKEANNKYPVARLKQWLGMMKKEFPQAQDLFERVRTLKEADEVKQVLLAFEAEQQAV